MFRRERSCPNCRELLRALRERDQTIREQNDRLMFMAGNAWNVPPSALLTREARPERESEDVVFDLDELEGV